MSDLVNFLWIAFHDYFLVWLSGGGIVGAILLGVGLWERKRGTSIKKSVYFSILAVALIVCATFSAWHDSQKNLKAVIGQREIDTSHLGACAGDLQTQMALTSSWQARFADQQKTINAFQAPQLQQQATINSCVVELGKMNPTIHREIRVIFYPSYTVEAQKIFQFFTLIVTNQDEPKASGELSCDKPVYLVTAASMATPSNSIVSTDTTDTISDHQIWLSFESKKTHWGPTTPMILQLRSPTATWPKCTFRPQ